MTKFLASFLFLFAVSCASTQKDDVARSMLHLEIGTTYLTKGNYPAALRELLIAEKLNPDSPVIQNNLGLVYYVRNKTDLAEKHFRQAITIEPKYSDSRVNLGHLLIDLRLYDQAIRELKVACDDLLYQYPDKALYNLGLAYFKKGDFKSSKDSLEKALEINRNNCSALNLYGRSLFELKNYSPAAESLDRAAETCRTMGASEPLYYAGLTYLRVGNREKAQARFEEIVQQHQNSPQAPKAKEALELMK